MAAYMDVISRRTRSASRMASESASLSTAATCLATASTLLSFMTANVLTLAAAEALLLLLLTCDTCDWENPACAHFFWYTALMAVAISRTGVKKSGSWVANEFAAPLRAAAA